MYKFFVEDNQIKDNKVFIIGENFNHIANVLRMQLGEKILVTGKNTEKTYNCIISKIEKDNVVCEILDEQNNSTELNIKIDLYQGLPKSDKMEFIIQKLTELGVNSIFPVNMKNCIAKIKDEEKKNVRWQKIAESASKQSKRDHIPKVYNSVNIQNICENISKYDLVLIAYENEYNNTIKKVLENNKNINNLAIIVGPEGGLDKKEIELLEKNGAISVSLGKRILRTETAPIAMISMIMYQYDL